MSAICTCDTDNKKCVDCHAADNLAEMLGKINKQPCPSCAELLEAIDKAIEDRDYFADALAEKDKNQYNCQYCKTPLNPTQATGIYECPKCLDYFPDAKSVAEKDKEIERLERIVFELVRKYVALPFNPDRLSCATYDSNQAKQYCLEHYNIEVKE